jgi:hypothetical protein
MSSWDSRILLQLIVYKDLALNTQQFYCWDEKDDPDEVRISICYNTGHEPTEKKQT